MLFPLPGNLPDLRIKLTSLLMSPAFVGRFFNTSATWEGPNSPQIHIPHLPCWHFPAYEYSSYILEQTELLASGTPQFLPPNLQVHCLFPDSSCHSCFKGIRIFCSLKFLFSIFLPTLGYKLHEDTCIVLFFFKLE